MTRTSRISPIGLLAGVFIIVALGIVLLNLSNISVSAHAVERHGDQAIIATQWVATHSGPGHRWDCKDGRQRWIVPYNAHEWAIVVLDGLTQVTAFITDDQDYVVKQHEGCKRWQNWAHP